MPIEVTARHVEVTSEMQAYARRKAEDLTEAFPRVEHVHVVLNTEKRRRLVEIAVQAKNHIRLEASGDTDNMVASIDAAVDKLERQLRRHRDKVQDHKPAMKHVAQTRERGIED